MRLPPTPPNYSPSYARPVLPNAYGPGGALPYGAYPYLPYRQGEEELKQQALYAPNYFYNFGTNSGGWGNGFYRHSFEWPTDFSSGTSSGYGAKGYNARALTLPPNAPGPVVKPTPQPVPVAKKAGPGLKSSPPIQDWNWSEIKAHLQEISEDFRKRQEKKLADKRLQEKNFAEKARLEKAKASKPATTSIKTAKPSVGQASSRGGFGVSGAGHASAAA